MAEKAYTGLVSFSPTPHLRFGAAYTINELGDGDIGSLISCCWEAWTMEPDERIRTMAFDTLSSWIWSMDRGSHTLPCIMMVQFSSDIIITILYSLKRT